MKTQTRSLKIRCFTAATLLASLLDTYAYAEILKADSTSAVKAPFDTEEAERLLEPGSGSLKGRLETSFKKGLITQTQHFYGAHQQVTLLPMSSYLKAWNEKLGKDPTTGVTFIDGRILPFSARTITDEKGNFEFTELRPGEYLMLAKIPYEVDGYRRLDTGKVQYNIDWAASTVTTSPIYNTKESKLDLVHSIYKIINIKESTPTIYKE